MKLLKSDKIILKMLQADLLISQADLAEHAGMSRSSCWRRVKEFEDGGVISARVALLDPKKLGFQITVMLSVSMKEHTDENRLGFEQHVENLPQVMECYSVSGDWDYILQVVAKDMDEYNDFLNEKILQHKATRTASSSFTLRCVKYSTSLPVSV